MHKEELEQIEISIQEAKKAIARKEAIDRLENNADYKLIISEGFLKDFAVRQVLLKAHPGLQEEHNQKLLEQNITAIGQLKQYMVNTYSEGVNAEIALAADEATQEELLQEDIV